MSNLPPTDPPRYIDISQFERLNGTAEIFPAVARVFRRWLPSWLEEVERCRAGEDPVQLADKLHKMKGCCGMMGAYGLSQEIAALEQRLTQSGLSASCGRLDHLLHQIQEMDAEAARLADVLGVLCPVGRTGG